MSRRVTFLLGAGASMEAGLPNSRALTEQIAKRLSGPYSSQTHTVAALNAVAGAMIAFDSTRGGSVFDTLDVERLFSAVEMLADRDNVELTPFVASWHAGIDSVGTSALPSTFGRDFREAVLADHFGDENTAKMFVRGVQALTGTASTSIFKELGDEMVRALREILIVDPLATSYLDPLVRYAASSSAYVATLNYDLAFEVAASRVGENIDTGVERWHGGLSWRWSNESVHRIRLLKLHGSIDWVYRQDEQAIRGIRDERLIELLDLDDAMSSESRRPPGLIFGQRGKLRSEGPFLAMLFELANVLSESDHLCIIGYSFRDDHINALLRSWFRQQDDPKITVVDPSFPDPRMLYTGQGNEIAGFVTELLEELYDPPDWSLKDPPFILKSGHSVERVGAGEAISRL